MGNHVWNNKKKHEIMLKTSLQNENILGLLEKSVKIFLGLCGEKCELFLHFSKLSGD